MGTAVLAYVSRPLSCGLALSQFTPDDDVPYARFDYHGFGSMTAWLLALLFAAPTLWLASQIFLSGSAKVRVLGRAENRKATLCSVLIALGIGAPMFSQACYLLGLPIGIAAPVLISALAWLLVVEVARTAAVEGKVLSRATVPIAATLAVLATVPKVALIALAFFEA